MNVKISRHGFSPKGRQNVKSCSITHPTHMCVPPYEGERFNLKSTNNSKRPYCALICVEMEADLA